MGDAFAPVRPELEFLARCEAQLDPPLEAGTTPRGRRRVIPIASGRFEGPRIAGDLVPGGADWQVVHEGGWASVEARYPLRTDDGALIVIQSRGVRTGPPEVLARIAAGEVVDPATYYFRTALDFEAPAGEYEWLNHVIAVASGVRTASAVAYDAYVVT